VGLSEIKVVNSPFSACKHMPTCHHISLSSFIPYSSVQAGLGVICKLTEGVPNPLIQIIDKDVKQDRILALLREALPYCGIRKD